FRHYVAALQTAEGFFVLVIVGLHPLHPSRRTSRPRRLSRSFVSERKSPIPVTVCSSSACCSKKERAREELTACTLDSWRRNAFPTRVLPGRSSGDRSRSS